MPLAVQAKVGTVPPLTVLANKLTVSPEHTVNGFVGVVKDTLKGAVAILVIVKAAEVSGDLEGQAKLEVTITVTRSPANKAQLTKESTADGAGALVPLICH